MSKKIKILFLMVFILILGIILRVANLDKPEGLWNDEYVSWAIASIPMGKIFWSAVVAQCHMPFYYLYLKFFHIFGNSDYILRLTSVIPGVLSIISMFFVGREIQNNQEDKDDNKLAILCAAVTSISSFLIYYSQEVRFYSLLFLFASLSLLFTLKLIKKQNWANILGYIIANFLIIITHTIGFVFVFLNLFFVAITLIKNNEQLKKKILIISGSLLLITIFVSPMLFNIFNNHPLSQWWGYFSVSKIGFLITDYFSPVLTNLVNAPDNFFYHFTYGFLVFAILPSLIAIAGIVKAISTRNKEITGLFFVSLGFLLTLVIMSITGKLMFITKYSIEIYPILIMIMAFGLLKFKNELRKFLIFSFCVLNLFYIALWPTSAPRMQRIEGHKLVANLLNASDLKKDDWVILTYYNQDRFEKYFNFDKYNVISINKNTFWEYLGLQPINTHAELHSKHDFDSKSRLGLLTQHHKTGYTLNVTQYQNKLKDDKQLKNDFKHLNDNYFDKKFDNQVLSKLKKNQKVAVVILNNVSMLSPMMMQSIVANDRAYSKTPFSF